METADKKRDLDTCCLGPGRRSLDKRDTRWAHWTGVLVSFCVSRYWVQKQETPWLRQNISSSINTGCDWLSLLKWSQPTSVIRSVNSEPNMKRISLKRERWKKKCWSHEEETLWWLMLEVQTWTQDLLWGYVSVKNDQILIVLSICIFLLN